MSKSNYRCNSDGSEFSLPAKTKKTREDIGLIDLANETGSSNCGGYYSDERRETNVLLNSVKIEHGDNDDDDVVSDDDGWQSFDRRNPIEKFVGIFDNQCFKFQVETIESADNFQFLPAFDTDIDKSKAYLLNNLLNLDAKFACEAGPLQCRQSLAFFIDTSKLNHPEDWKRDDLGRFKHSGTKKFPLVIKSRSEFCFAHHYQQTSSSDETNCENCILKASYWQHASDKRFKRRTWTLIYENGDLVSNFILLIYENPFNIKIAPSARGKKRRGVQIKTKQITQRSRPTDNYSATVMCSNMTSVQLHQKSDGRVFLLCPHCPQQFLFPRSLVRHIGEEHKANEQHSKATTTNYAEVLPQFLCPYCNKQFSDAYGCRRHIKIHLNASGLQQTCRNKMVSSSSETTVGGVNRITTEQPTLGIVATSSSYKSGETVKSPKVEETCVIEEESCEEEITKLLCMKEEVSASATAVVMDESDCTDSIVSRHRGSQCTADNGNIFLPMNQGVATRSRSAATAVKTVEPNYFASANFSRDQCPCCPKTFEQQQHLKRHFISHSGEKPFSCDKCSSKFWRKDKLASHKKSHGRLNKTQSSLNNWYNHSIPSNNNTSSNGSNQISRSTMFLINSNQPGKGYSCDECSRSFLTKAAVISHKKTHFVKRMQIQTCESNNLSQNHSAEMPPATPNVGFHNYTNFAKQSQTVTPQPFLQSSYRCAELLPSQYHHPGINVVQVKTEYNSEYDISNNSQQLNMLM